VHEVDLASEPCVRPTSEKGVAILYGKDMRNVAKTLKVRTHRRGLVEITSEVRGWVDSQKVTTGLLTVFCRHTSASLLIQENAAREVRTDLEAFFETIAPESPGTYAHDDEGPDDMPAHLRTALTGVQLSIPVIDGQLSLGTWQGIYLFEHRARPHDREVALHLLGD
jgi:secondary thiamine-phosphate synthase enzyme